MKYALVILMLAAFFGCSRQQAPTNEETATNGTLELVADESLRPAIDSLVQGFMLENKRAHVTVRYESAGQAIEDLLNQKARVVIVGRHLAPVERRILSDAKLSLPEFDMAETGIGVVVSAKNPLQAISMTDLTRIYRNEITDWSKLEASVGRSSGAIHRILPSYASSIEWALDSALLPPNVVPQGAISRYSTTDSVLAGVRKDPLSIAFVESATKHMLDRNRDSSVRVIPLIPQGATKAVMLHPAYIYQKVYPLTTEINGYTFDSPNTLSRGFLAYAMTTHGQSVFKNFDILPKTQVIRLVPSHD